MSNAVNETNMGDVPNTEGSMKSGKRLRILINPRELPPVPATATIRLPDVRKMPMETRRAVRDYFWDKYARGEKQARERKWI